MGHEPFTEKFHISYLQLFIEIYLFICNYLFFLFSFIGIIGTNIYLQITTRSHVTPYHT